MASSALRLARVARAAMRAEGASRRLFLLPAAGGHEVESQAWPRPLVAAVHRRRSEPSIDIDALIDEFPTELKKTATRSSVIFGWLWSEQRLREEWRLSSSDYGGRRRRPPRWRPPRGPLRGGDRPGDGSQTAARSRFVRGATPPNPPARAFPTKYRIAPPPPRPPTRPLATALRPAHPSLPATPGGARAPLETLGAAPRHPGRRRSSNVPPRRSMLRGATTSTRCSATA